VGESGSGKTVTAESIMSFVEDAGGSADGEIRLRGESLLEKSGTEMEAVRGDSVAMVFQDPMNTLNPVISVGEQIAETISLHQDVGESVSLPAKLKRKLFGAVRHSESWRRAIEMLETVEIPEAASRATDLPHEFSGGMHQRAMIATALSCEPDLLIADEPVSPLDVSVQAQILTLLEELRDDLGLTILFIAHDLSVVRYIADRVTVMYLGEIVERGPVEALFESPQHPYTRSLLSAVPRIDPGDRSDRIVLRGSVPSPINPPEGCRFHTRCPVVIPPPDWQGTPEEFEQAFEYRNRILTQEIDVEAIQDRLRAANETVDRSHVVDTIIDQSYPGDCSELPGEKAEAVEDVARAIAAGDHDRGRALAREAFPSPCEAEVPDSHPVEGGHSAACHRAGPRDAGRAARGR